MEFLPYIFFIFVDGQGFIDRNRLIDWQGDCRIIMSYFSILFCGTTGDLTICIFALGFDHFDLDWNYFVADLFLLD